MFNWVMEVIQVKVSRRIQALQALYLFMVEIQQVIKELIFTQIIVEEVMIYFVQ